MPNKKRLNEQRRDIETRRTSRIVLVTGCGLLIAAFLYFVNTSQTGDTSQTVPKKGDAITEMAVKQIASLFNCVCGDCTEDSLDLCSCESAHKEKHEIQTMLRQGKSQDEIVKAISAKYGGLKS